MLEHLENVLFERIYLYTPVYVNVPRERKKERKTERRDKEEKKNNGTETIEKHTVSSFLRI